MGIQQANVGCSGKWSGHAPWLPYLLPQLVAIDGELCPGVSGPRLPACLPAPSFPLGWIQGAEAGEMGAEPWELLHNDQWETLSHMGFPGDKAGLCASG